MSSNTRNTASSGSSLAAAASRRRLYECSRRLPHSPSMCMAPTLSISLWNLQTTENIPTPFETRSAAACGPSFGCPPQSQHAIVRRTDLHLFTCANTRVRRRSGVGWRGTARTRLAKAARSANRPRQYAHFSRCSPMTLEESALSSLSKYASSSLSKSRQLIRSLRGTLSRCGWPHDKQPFSLIENSPLHGANWPRAPTGPPAGESLRCRAATGVNRPRRQSVAPFYSLWSRHSDRRMCETSTTAPTPGHVQGFTLE